MVEHTEAQMYAQDVKNLVINCVQWLHILGYKVADRVR